MDGGRADLISLKPHCALILPGAVAKGAYEAGAIEELTHREIRIDRIVATSSGALNGVAYAAGIRNGQEKEMAAKLVKAWIEEGGWHDNLSVSPWNWWKGRGLSDAGSLSKRLTTLVTPSTNSVRREVELRIIVAPLNGIHGTIGNRSATTYEKVLSFSGKDFDSAAGLARIFNATIAACAFPGLFAPVEIDGLGPCVDGGAVNNAPITYALDQNDVNRIYMPIPFPGAMPRRGNKHWWGLLNHLIEILINERVYRDLKNAQDVNAQVAALEALAVQGDLTEDQIEKVKRALHIRAVDVIEIRPAQTISNNPFSGFFSKPERKQLVEEGRQAARAIFSTNQ